MLSSLIIGLLPKIGSGLCRDSQRVLGTLSEMEEQDGTASHGKRVRDNVMVYRRAYRTVLRPSAGRQLRDPDLPGRGLSI
jgi:hypothetical protein